jgi:excisionase family DNA binding protein
MQDKKYFTLRELSERFSIPLSTLRRWASERRFPLYRVSNRILVSASEWSTWLEEFHCDPSRPNFSPSEKLGSKP